jgi:hypothetical protein
VGQTWVLSLLRLLINSTRPAKSLPQTTQHKNDPSNRQHNKQRRSVEFLSIDLCAFNNEEHNPLAIRKRRRPKTAAQFQAEEESRAQQPAERRPRGRPRKPTPAEPPTLKVPGKRGRPRKDSRRAERPAPPPKRRTTQSGSAHESPTEDAGDGNADTGDDNADITYAGSWDGPWHIISRDEAESMIYTAFDLPCWTEADEALLKQTFWTQGDESILQTYVSKHTNLRPLWKSKDIYQTGDG